MEIETKLKIRMYWDVDNTGEDAWRIRRYCQFPLVVDSGEPTWVGSICYHWPRDVWLGASFDKIASCRELYKDYPGERFDPLHSSNYNYEGDLEKIKSLIERDIKFYLNELLYDVDKEITIDDEMFVLLIPELLKHVKITKETGKSYIPASGYYDLETKTWMVNEWVKAVAEEEQKKQ